MIKITLPRRAPARPGFTRAGGRHWQDNLRALPYGCHPLAASIAEDEDGYCWTGETFTADRVNNAGASCVWDHDCYSPFGRGYCIPDRGTAWSFGVCVIEACDFDGMDVYCAEADDKVCEPQGEGNLSLCLERCDDPGGGMGPDHGCSRLDYACYPSVTGGGAGVCLPGCDFDADCRAFFGMVDIDCDVASGTCSPDPRL